jgi:phage-related protein
VADFEVSGEASIDPDGIVEDVSAIIDKLDELETKLDEVGAKLDEIGDKGVNIEVVIDGQDKLDELKAFLDELDAKDYTVDIKINIEGEEDIVSLVMVTRELEDAPHDIDYKIKIDGLAESETELKTFGKQVDDTSKKLDSAGESSSKFEFSIKMLAPLLIPLSAALLSTVGGAMGLASAFGTMLAPVALVAYGTDQLYQSVSTLYSGLNAATQAALLNSQSMDQSIKILDKNSAAFKAMSKSAQGVVLEYVFLKQQLADFQKEIQPESTAILTDAMGLLAQAIGDLTPAAVGAGEAIDEVLQDMSGRMNDPTFQKFFKDMADNVQLLVSDWGNGVLNIIEGIVALLDAFMPLGVSMSGGFDKMTQSFDTWAQHLAQSAGFKKFIATVETDGPLVLNILGQIIKFVANLVGALGEQSGNKGFLTFLDNMLKDLNNFTSTHEGLTGVATDLSLMALAASKLGPALGPLMSFIATPMGAAVAAVLALAVGFVTLYEKSASFRDWVNKNLLPTFKDIEGDLSQVKQWFIGIWPDIESAWKTYGGNIESIITGMFAGWGKIFGGGLKVIEGLFDIFFGLITGKWSLVWKGIEDVFTGFWKIIEGIFQGAWAIVSNMVSMGWTYLVKLFEAPLTAVENFFLKTLGSVVTNVESFFGRVVSGAETWGTNFINTIASKLATVGTFFAKLPGEVVSWLGNMSEVLINAGWNLVQGFINGIENAIPGLSSLLKTLTGWLPSWKGPPSKDKTILYSSGQMVIQGFMDGLESKYPAVASSLGGFTKNIGNTFGSQFTTDLSTKLNADLNSRLGAGLGTGGNLPGGGTTVTIAAGAIQINNPTPEPASQSLTKSLQSVAVFGINQAPMGAQFPGQV